MSTIRLTALLVAFIAATAFGAASQAWAQQKYTIPRTPEGPNEYLQEHTIDVGDESGHQVQTDSSGGRKFVFVENFVGGTGKLKGMRGQLHGSGERAPGQNH